MLLEIVSYEFKPSDLYKLDSKYQDKGDCSKFLLGDRQALKIKANGTHDYGSYNALQAPRTLALFFHPSIFCGLWGW